MLRALSLGVVFSMALCGCHEPGTGAGALPPSSGSADEKQADPSTSGKLRVPRGEVVSFAEELETVSRLRGLSPMGEMKGLRVSEAELLDHVKNSVRLERPDISLKGTEAMLVGLGVVPPDFDFEQTMLGLLSSSLAGLYEPRLKMMLLRDGLGTAEARVTLLHELVHALQDQYFDLKEVIEYRQDDSDVSSAVSSLAEGDATSAMLDGMLPEGQTALAIPEDQIEAQFFSRAPNETAPPVVIRSLFAPYIDGLRFVNAMRRRGGWAAVDRAWKISPKSTEQILHIDKFDAQEPPVAVDVPAPPSSEWKLLFHDIWGEQSLRIILREWVDREQAERAAAGWGGDRIAVFSRGDSIAVAWDLRMDSENEAIELEKTLEKALSAETALATTRAATPSAGAASDSDVACASPPNTAVRLAWVRRSNALHLRSVPFHPSKNHSEPCSIAHGWLSTPSPQTTPSP